MNPKRRRLPIITDGPSVYRFHNAVPVPSGTPKEQKRQGFRHDKKCRNGFQLPQSKNILDLINVLRECGRPPLGGSSRASVTSVPPARENLQARAGAS